MGRASLGRHYVPGYGREGGQAMLEYALVLPILLLLIMGGMVAMFASIERMTVTQRLDSVEYSLPADWFEGTTDDAAKLNSDETRRLLASEMNEQMALTSGTVTVEGVSYVTTGGSDLVVEPTSEGGSADLVTTDDPDTTLYSREDTTLERAYITIEGRYDYASYGLPKEFFIWGAGTDSSVTFDPKGFRFERTVPVVISRTADISGTLDGTDGTGA
jgi:hypothetical protein